MNKDIILNYFLSVGSSYRYSDAWAKKFIDENKKSRIARTGKFGIGVLTSFLIGSTVMIKTRRLGEKLGFQF